MENPSSAVGSNSKTAARVDDNFSGESQSMGRASDRDYDFATQTRDLLKRRADNKSIGKHRGTRGVNPSGIGVGGTDWEQSRRRDPEKLVGSD